MMMNPIRFWLRGLALAAAMFATSAAFATAQQPDRLLVDGKEERLNTNPLEPWREAHKGTTPRMPMLSTANWRGYVATWEVADGKLWLRSVIGRREGDAERGHDYLPELFPGRTTVVADWFTGTLIVPRGKLVDYVHMGYGSTYERYLVIWIRKGEVARQLELTAEQFVELRRERFERFRQTEEYQRHIASLRTDVDVETLASRERFLFEFLSERYLSIEFEDAAAK